MMRSLLILIGLTFAETAFAVGGLNDPQRFAHAGGEENAAVTSMITQICEVMPFCDVGPDAFLLFAVKIARFVSSVIGVLAVTMLLYASIKIIMSQGNEEGVSDAKKIAIWALGGLVLAITGQAVVQYFVTVVVPAAISV